MAEWSWAIGPGASQLDPRPTRELGAAAYGRTITWRTRGHAVAQFSIDGRSEIAAEIEELATDLWCWRNQQLMFRGRITTMPDRLNATSHQLQVTAIDYRGMCGYRTLWNDPPAWTNTDQAEILWGLLDHSQSKPGGDWGITRGLIPAGTPRDRPAGYYAPAKNLLDAMTELGNVQGGFEWEISPEMELNVWSPRRGVVRTANLDFGGQVAEVEATTDPSRFGNAVIVTGGQDTLPVVEETDDLAADPRGRWEQTRSWASVTRQESLVERAPVVLADSVALAAPLTVTFGTAQPAGHVVDGGNSRWTGPDMLWLGDVTPVRVNSGRLAGMPLMQRVMEMQITPGDSGTETVRVSLVPEVSEFGDEESS